MHDQSEAAEREVTSLLSSFCPHPFGKIFLAKSEGKAQPPSSPLISKDGYEVRWVHGQQKKRGSLGYEGLLLSCKTSCVFISFLSKQEIRNGWPETRLLALRFVASVLTLPIQ